LTKHLLVPLLPMTCPSTATFVFRRGLFLACNVLYL
jgi:hypothetical protein